MLLFIQKNIKYIGIVFIIIISIVIFNVIKNRDVLEPDDMYETEKFTSPNYPAIRQFENVFTDDECKQIIDLAKPKLVRSTTGANPNIDKERTSSQVWLERTALPCIERCSKQVEKLTGLPVEHQEEWQVLRYEPGQQYTAHFDACNKEEQKYNECVANEVNEGWGKRAYTFFIYLNDVDGGGETNFPLLQKSFTPQKGKAILWHNLTDDQSESHPYSKHAGLPVKRGVKWAINVWVRQYPRK